ncbi:hypothetical protein ACMZOO_07955 [Catenovulum sp. SX2]
MPKFPLAAEIGYHTKHAETIKGFERIEIGAIGRNIYAILNKTFFEG